jgi:hypothetical protein
VAAAATAASLIAARTRGLAPWRSRRCATAARPASDHQQEAQERAAAPPHPQAAEREADHHHLVVAAPRRLDQHQRVPREQEERNEAAPFLLLRQRDDRPGRQPAETGRERLERERRRDRAAAADPGRPGGQPGEHRPVMGGVVLPDRQRPERIAAQRVSRRHIGIEPARDDHPAEERVVIEVGRQHRRRDNQREGGGGAGGGDQLERRLLPGALAQLDRQGQARIAACSATETATNVVRGSAASGREKTRGYAGPMFCAKSYVGARPGGRWR